jgi:nucleoside-diphosphate-sugar epimerase
MQRAWRYETMRIAITGATGNVGTSCVAALLEEPRVSQIVAIARRVPSFTLPRVFFVTGDVSKDDPAPWFEGVDAVVHLAWDVRSAHDRKRLWENNVEGSLRVFEGAARAGVRTLVHASSVGVYSEGPRNELVEESWPREGIATSQYSLQKAAVERQLDVVEARFPDLRVVRMRPALVFKRDAASRIQQLFLGPLFPHWLLKPGRVPFVPQKLALQCLHSLDVASAFRSAVMRDVRGAFNLATDPVLDSRALARVLSTRTVNVSPRVIRAVAAAAFQLRLQPSEPGWIDLAFKSPMLCSRRAREELDWRPRYDSVATLLELLEGIREGAGIETPPLSPRSKHVNAAESAPCEIVPRQRTQRALRARGSSAARRARPA